MVDLRETALQNLQNIFDGKPQSGGLLQGLSKEDNAFVRMLVLTSLRHWVYIHRILKSLITQRLSKQNMVSRYALVLGITELLYMQTPDYAVINSYVNLVKKLCGDKYTAGFVNAVLRNVCRSKQKFLDEDNGVFLSQKFRTLLRRSYSAKTVDAIERAAMTEPALDITCISDESASRLGGTKLPLGTIRLISKGAITQLPDYEKGTWWVQDFSAALAVKMLDNLSGKKVLELCSAPGGKTAQLLSAGAKLTCVDIAEERLKTLKENLDRLKLCPEQIVCADGLEFLRHSNQKYEIVLLDAPCSATGTLRRHPEVAHLKTIDDVMRQAALQKQFLALVDNAVAPNGTLLYCTCSLCKEEGEDQIVAFLETHPQYKIVNLAAKVPSQLAAIVSGQGFIRVLPQHLEKFGGADGFFIACLQKAE